MKRQAATISSFGFALIPVGAFAQNAASPQLPINYSNRKIAAVKTTTPPTIDGDLSDACWATAPTAETFTDGQNGNLVADGTTAQILYDEKFLYVSFKCKDSQSDKIVARETVRDTQYQGNGTDDDNVEVSFDAFNTRKFEALSRFSLNALGTRSALLAGGRANKVEWQGDWDGAVKRTTEGWTAEMRIPWKILNYPSSKKPLNIGLNFGRFQNRTRIFSQWSNLTASGFLEREGEWTGVEAPKTAFRPHTSLLPYVLFGNKGGTPTFNSGVDARITLTPQLTGIASLNPDFATVENALTSIQFSRRERIADETRPFFLEGGNNFRVANINIIGNYFLSQRIGRFDVGTKLYGNVTSKDRLGLLQTIEFGKRNDFALNWNHSQSDTSSIDFFVSQKSANDDNNTVGVVNEQFRRGKLDISGQVALSSGRNAGGDAKQFSILYQDKLNLSAIAYQEVSPLFRAADGFVSFTDNRGALLVENWGAEWRKGFWRGFFVNAEASHSWHYDGKPFQRGGDVSLNLQTRKDVSLNFGANYNRFDEQTDATFSAGFTVGSSNRFRQWGADVSWGKLGDRPSFFVGPHFSYRVFRKLDIGFNGSVQSLDGVTHQQQLTFNYELSPTRSLGGRVVFQNGATNAYAFYRNSGGKGVNLFVIFGDPNAQKSVLKLQVKAVYPFG